MYYDQIRTVQTPGLIQENDVREWNYAKMHFKKFFDEISVGFQGRPEIVRLEKGNLPAFRSASTGLPDKWNVTLITPEEDFFYCWLTHYTEQYAASGNKETGELLLQDFESCLKATFFISALVNSERLLTNRFEEKYE